LAELFSQSFGHRGKVLRLPQGSLKKRP
jgi:hypothetical protein